jgi:hypothetical protein
VPLFAHVIAVTAPYRAPRAINLGAAKLKNFPPRPWERIPANGKDNWKGEMTTLSEIVGALFVVSVGGGGTYALYRIEKTPLGQWIGDWLERVHRHLPGLVGLIMLGVVWAVPVYTWAYFFPTEWVCDDWPEADEDSCVRKR